MAGAPGDFVQQSKALIARRQYQEAVKVCRLGLLQHPGVVEGRVVLGQALMALGRHDEVLGEMRVAIEADPSSATAYLLKGEAHYLKGDYQEAEEALLAARRLGGPDQQRATLLLAEIESARRDGLFPDRTSEGPGTKEYPAFRAFREMAEHAPGGEPGPPGGLPSLPPSLDGDFDEPDSTMVDEMPPEFFNAAPVVSLVPPGGRLPSSPGWSAQEQTETRPWDPDAGEEPTSPVQPAAPASLLPPALASRPTPFDQGHRPVSASGSIDARASLPLTETGSIQLGESDLVPEGEPADEIDDADVDDEGIEPDDSAVSTVAERPQSPPAPPAWLAEPPGQPVPAVAPKPQEPWRPYSPPAEPAPPPARPEPWSTGRQPVIAPRQVIASAEPRESPEWGGARPAAPYAPDQFEEESSEETIPAKRRALRNPAPRLAPALSPTPSPAPETPPWLPRPVAPRAPDFRAGAAQWEPEPGEDETTNARPSPIRTPPPPTWRERLEAHLGEGPARVRRLAALGGAALLFVVAVSLVIGALGARHRAQSQLAVAWRQITTGNYPGYQIALRAFEQAAAERPRDARALTARAYAAAALSLEFGAPVAPAKEAIAAAAARAAGQPDLVAAEGYLALVDGDLKGAETRARALSAQQPKDPRGPYLEARVRLEEGAAPGAVPLLAEALNRDPRNLAALRTLGEAQAAARRATEARAAWQRALALNPIHVGSVLDQALYAVRRRDDLAGAETALVAVVSGRLRSHAAPAQIAWAHLGLGRLYLERGEGSRAAAELAKAASSRPERDPHFAEELCAAYLRAGDSARAREEIPRFASLPSQLVALRRGALAVLEGQPATAIHELRKTALGDPEARLWRGRALRQEGKLDDAGHELQAALDAAPRMLAARLELARLDVLQGRVTAAYGALARLNEEEPGNAQVLEALGEALLARGDRNLAKARFAEAVQRSPGLALARLQLARLLRAEGHWDQARAHLEGALAAQPELLEARRELALVLYELGDGPASRREWEAVLQRRPDAATAIAAARAASLARDSDAASRLADRAQQLGPGRALPLREWGRAHLVQRDPQRALQRLRAALRLDPHDLEATMLYFDALLDTGDLKAVRKELPKAVKRFPRAVELGLTRGRLEIEAGDGREALAALEPTRAKLKDRGAPPRLQAECLTLVGRAYFIESNLKAAAEALAEARTRDPRNAQAHYFGGVVLAELDRQADAAQAFERAVAVDPRFADAWFRLAESRQKQKVAGAAAAYREYLKLAPAGAYAGDAREKLQALESSSPAAPLPRR